MVAVAVVSERETTGVGPSGTESAGAERAEADAPGIDSRRTGSPTTDSFETEPRGDFALDDLSDGSTEPPDPAERWMYRDDEFLLDEDREYVLRDEGRSLLGYVSPVLFGAVLAVMVGDVVTTGVGLAMGLEEANPVASLVIREAGLGGLVVLKAMAAVVLLLLPGVTSDARGTFRAGSAVYLVVGLLVVVSNAWAILAVSG